MTGALKLACSTGSFWMWDLDRSFGTIAEAGFESVELMVTRDPRTQSAEAPRALAAREGLQLVAVHAPMLVVTRRVWGTGFLDKITRSASLASELGAGIVVVHPPYFWEVAYQAWLLGRLDSYSEEQGIDVAVENMFRLWVRGRPVRGHRWVSPADLARFSRITLDTSHCGVDGFDILEALDLAGPHTVHVHLSDNLGDRRDDHGLPGSGILPLEDFLKRLPDSGARGYVSLELDLRGRVGDPRGLVESLRRAREFCEDHLG